MSGDVECRCGHPRIAHEHEGLAPQCMLSGCQCLQFRPRITAASLPPRPENHGTPVPQAGAPTVAPSADQLIQAGARSGSKRTAALAAKIAALLGDLRGRLADERVAAEDARRRAAVQEKARAEILRLERELAAAKAALRDGAPPQNQDAAGSGDSGRRAGVPGLRATVHPDRQPEPASAQRARRGHRPDRCERVPVPGLRQRVRHRAGPRRTPRPGTRLPQGRVNGE